MQRFIAYTSIIATLLLSVACEHTQEKRDRAKAEAQQAEVAAIPAGEHLYGLPVDSFVIEHHTVKRRENFGSIMARYGVSPLITHNVNENALPLFDFRNIRAGNCYTLFFSPDTLHSLRYFIYDIDAKSYLRCSIDEQPKVSLENRIIHSEEHFATATIETSLWTALTNQGLSPELALDLSEIYAWTIDFFGIEKGDKIGVIYTENFVDSLSIGIDKIIAAYMDL